MNDILFRNNNNKIVIKRLTRRSYFANRRRNLFIIISLVLTSFMLTSIFSIGFSYFKTYQMQQIRLMGTTADVALISPTDKQLRQLEQSELVLDLGKSQRLGNIEAGQVEDSLLGLVWLDEQEWNLHRIPTITGLHGTYPNKENEIMFPTWVLEKLGISSPELGMNISLNYRLENSNNNIEGDFILSGFYTDYMYARTNNRGVGYVSEDFRNKTKIPFSEGGSAVITFSGDGTRAEKCERLRETFDLKQNQEFEMVPINEGNGGSIIIIMAIIITCIAFSGYLLIYNILYISISRDIHFYGQLKTLGATKRQIKKIVRQQVFRMCVLGIPIGLLFGAAVSFGIVPYALNMMYSGNKEMGIELSFSPCIFVIAAIFSFITAFVGSEKPAKIAGNISPIAALCYTEGGACTRIRKKSQGTKLNKMAFINIFRNKKSALLVFSSLFLGLSLFLFTAGLLASLSPDNFVEQWGESDFVLTYSIHDKNELITEEMLSKICEIKGIDGLRLTYVSEPTATMSVEYDENVFKNYLRSLDGKAGVDFSNPQKESQYKKNFFSGVYGIDTSYVEDLNNILKDPIDITRFEKGESVILSEMLDNKGDNLIQPGKKIKVEGEKGTQIFTVANGFLAKDFQSGRGNERGTAPDLYISKNALMQLSSKCKIFRIAFNTAGDQDESILQRLKTITASSPEVEIISRLEKRREMSGYIITSRVLGMSLSAILLLIGIMNFVNMMVVSVNTRKHEFAILESIGMTKKQLKKVLMYEGIHYWGISFALLVTLGSIIYAVLYFLFKNLVPYAVFVYPILPLIFIMVLILFVCVTVPVITYKYDLKGSITKRLREE